MPEGAQLLLPRRPLPAWRSLLGRLSVAVAIVVVIALLAFFDRGGYSDADGTPLTLLDAVYDATVTATTTGYGDIAPISPFARAVTAFIVTPLRVIFLIVLVGTTVELLTERFRQSRAVDNWRKRVDGHSIVIGYGVMGETAVETLARRRPGARRHHRHRPPGRRRGRAREAGLVTVIGDATREDTLRTAEIERASAVIVACNRDDTATLVTLTARELDPGRRSPRPCARRRTPTSSSSPAPPPSCSPRRRRDA